MTNYDPFDIPGQEADAEDKATKGKLEKETEEEDIKWLMGSKRG